MAKLLRSKEKRTNARLIVLTVVVNTEGFLKYSDIFEGNTSGCGTLQSVVAKLHQKMEYISNKPIVVMIAGIATEANFLF